MKILDGYNLMNIAGENIVVPLGAKNIDLKSLLSLNNSGVFLWELLKTERSEEELLQSLLAEYDVEETQAKKDLEIFISKLRSAGIIQ